MSIRFGFSMRFGHGWIGPNAAVLVGRFDVGAVDGSIKIYSVLLPFPCAVEFALTYNLRAPTTILRLVASGDASALIFMHTDPEYLARWR